MLTGKEYHRTLPAKRMGAGAILRDHAGRVLVVEPTYKKEWEIPGGVVEALESPLSTVLRELQEELALRFHSYDFTLLSVDYLYEDDRRTEGLMFLFYGPVLDDEAIGRIELANSELASFEFAHPKEAALKLGPVVGPRLIRALNGLESGSFVYWEDGEFG